jgi:hypothetical protein
MKPLSATGFLLRFIVAIILVFCTYNPEGYSYYDWVLTDLKNITPLKVLAGMVLLIGWIIYIRATIRSLGAIGLILAFAFFGTLVWLVVDWGLIPTDSVRAVSYIILFLICAVLAIGISWSHIRRRISGQLDVDEIEEG